MALHIRDVAPGAVLVADGAFTCLKQGETVTVGADKDGLFVPCNDGHHYLDGQQDGDGFLIGLEKA